MSKKYTISWWNKLTVNRKLQFFINWRILTSNNKKHWCLNDIEEDKESLKSMINDMLDLKIEGEPIRYGVLKL